MPAYIQSIGTAVPKHKIDQRDIASFLFSHLDLTPRKKRELMVLHRASGIQSRHSVSATDADPFDFYNNGRGAFPSVEDRMGFYQEKALTLALEAVKDCLPDTFEPSTITHLITVSCTGMYAPGIDIELIEGLGLPTHTERICINFMGCYAAFTGLKTAQRIIGSTPGSRVLLVAVELCSIHLQQETTSDDLLSNTLFGDGAAAVLVTDNPNGRVTLEITRSYGDLALEGKKDMGWYIGNLGFKMKLTHEVPALIRSGIGELSRRLLDNLGLRAEEIDYFAIHPGGRKILEVIEQEIGITKEDNSCAYEVLRKYGNMSSPTVLFVLKALCEKLTPADQGKRILSFAFGPGLTLESMLLTIHGS